MKWSTFFLPLALSAALPLQSFAQITVTPTSPPTQSSTVPPAAADLLTQAQAATRQASANPATPTPDQPDWREAIRLGEEARDAAPDNVKVLRFLAETYSTVSWDSRAWEAWGAYLAAGGELDAAARQGLSEAGRELGYARYSAGEPESAAAIFGRVLELEPDNVETLTWLGRIALERGQSAASAGYWRQVLTLRPGNAAARYYLQQSQQQRTYGAKATQAFNDGLAAYNQDQKAAALAAFTAAARANPAYSEAFSWAGRVALELGRPQAAKTFWQALLERNPQNREASYFLSLAEAQERWGSDAGRAFYTGQELYNQGQVEAAAERFVAASEANPQYPAAASWAARSLQESGQAGRAVPYWQRVVRLNPGDESARFFLEAAQAQQDVAGGAVVAFNEGLQAYQEADLSAAESAFRTATQQDPSYADAWGWLGRLAFEGQRYGEADTAYSRALGLEPDNSTYQFFQGEARRLGGQ